MSAKRMVNSVGEFSVIEKAVTFSFNRREQFSLCVLDYTNNLIGRSDAKFTHFSYAVVTVLVYQNNL